jgi:hypothetical protein
MGWGAKEAIPVAKAYWDFAELFRPPSFILEGIHCGFLCQPDIHTERKGVGYRRYSETEETGLHLHS